VPARVYRTKEDDVTEIEENIPEDGDNPVAPIPTSSQMGQLSSWVHYTQNILKCNRLRHMDINPETLDLKEDEDLETVIKRINSADPFEKRLKPIT
jgi:hypothetical protein